MRLTLVAVACLTLVSCGARKKEAKGENTKEKIEARVVELTCECLESKNNGLTKKEWEDARDQCLRESFPTLQAEFGLSEENNPYGGMMQMMAAWDRIKDGIKDSCPWKE